MKKPVKKKHSGGLPLREDVLAFIGAHKGKAGVREIARAFGLKNADRAALRQMVRGLTDEGAIEGRRKKLLDRYASRQPSADGVAREPDPLGWLLADERKAMVHQALKTLPPRDAEIMLLKYSEDWSYQQLAEHLGLSVSAVEARLHRARQKMRQQLCKLDPSLKARNHEH